MWGALGRLPGPGRAGILEDFVYDNAGPGLLRPSRRRTRVTYLMFMWVFSMVFHRFSKHFYDFPMVLHTFSHDFFDFPKVLHIFPLQIIDFSMVFIKNCMLRI